MEGLWRTSTDTGVGRMGRGPSEADKYVEKKRGKMGKKE
jgi:hypothetical protein